MQLRDRLARVPGSRATRAETEALIAGLAELSAQGRELSAEIMGMVIERRAVTVSLKAVQIAWEAQAEGATLYKTRVASGRGPLLTYTIKPPGGGPWIKDAGTQSPGGLVIPRG